MNTSTLVATKRSLDRDSEYDGEFLELWADNELTKEEQEISELFSGKRDQVTRESERTPSPFIKRPKPSQNQRRPSNTRYSPKSANQINKRVASEIHVVSAGQQFIRKKSNQAKHTSDYKPGYSQPRKRPAEVFSRPTSVAKPTTVVQANQSTRQICDRLNLQVRLNNPLANKRSIAIQTTFESREHTKLEERLKAAELKVQKLQQQLLKQQEAAVAVENPPCQKCAKRTNQRNIRQRINQKKYKEFFVANQGSAAGTKNPE